MYVHLWATQSINQEFKFETAPNSKNLRQVLNPKLGITLRVSVTSATILTAKRTIHTQKYISMVLLTV